MLIRAAANDEADEDLTGPTGKACMAAGRVVAGVRA